MAIPRVPTTLLSAQRVYRPTRIISSLRPTRPRPIDARSSFYQRHLSTSAPPPEPKSTRSWPLTLLLVALGAGLGAYTAHQYSLGRNPLVPRTFRTSAESRVAGLNNLYGSPSDFAKAIQKLREALTGDEQVSTDEDDLEVHGFSENDYHPGASPASCQGARRVVNGRGQARARPWSCTPPPRRMW